VVNVATVIADPWRPSPWARTYLLAGVLIEHAGVDPILRKKLRMLLAAI
jgi:hypothetical protein